MTGGIIQRRYPRAVQVSERAGPLTLDRAREVVRAARQVMPPGEIARMLVRIRAEGAYDRYGAYLAAAAWREALADA